MATQRIADWQRSDRRLFAAVAILFPILVLIGFGRTYYLSTLVGGPPVKSLLVHVHGALMTLWIALFVTQVFLIRAHQRALHKVLGWYGVALAGAMVVAGVLTAAAAGKYGSLSAPPEIPPLVFMAIPMTDLLMFVVFFGAAIYWRTRAAAADFRTARLLGVKANQVIGLAVVLSGALAATVAVILTVQTPFVTPDFALHDTIIVLVGVVVGGIDRLWTATLGGFAIGFVSGIVNGALPTDSTVYLPSVVFVLVILVLLLRPAGLFVRGRTSVVDRV